MREYDFNKYGVCINPECYTFKCDQGNFQIETAFLNGFWVNGYHINLSDRGCGHPVSIDGTKFKSEQDATNNACERIKRYLYGLKKVDKLVREAESLMNRQLELFPDM